MTVVAVVVVHVVIATIEVQVPCVVGIALVERRTPVVAVAAHVVGRRTVAVARSGAIVLTTRYI